MPGSHHDHFSLPTCASNCLWSTLDNLRMNHEDIAGFAYRPSSYRMMYRLVVVQKNSWFAMTSLCRVQHRAVHMAVRIT